MHFYVSFDILLLHVARGLIIIGITL